MIVRALTVRQPYASMIADGKKTIELRTWSTKYRGRIMITSSAAKPDLALREAFPAYADAPRGVAICTVLLAGVRETRESDSKASACDLEGEDHEDLFSWILREPLKVKPRPIKGKLGLWRIV